MPLAQDIVEAKAAPLRSFSQKIPNRAGSTDEQHGGRSIIIPDTEPTPAPAPTIAPLLNNVNAERLRHTVEASIDRATRRVRE